MAGEGSVEPLLEALAVTPENLPLRLHVADWLLNHGRPDEAERLARDGLAFHAASEALKLRLAKAFFGQDKRSHALVVLEEVLALPQPPAEAYLLHAKVSLREGDVQRAVTLYHQARDADPSLADEDLEEQLGIDAEEDEDTEEIIEGKMRLLAAGADAEGPPVEIEKPTMGFDDVGGMDKLKEEIRLKIIAPLQHPEMFAAYGKKVGGGILLYGPPGCGKTHLARATAGEIEAKFLSVGIDDVLDMWVGNSERNLHAIFEQARASKPCVLFFDEVDALAASRSDMRQSAGRLIINQFLAELDGLEANNDGLLILAATNAPWHLDPAFRRPGRFDRIVFVPPPDTPARGAILRILLKGKPAEGVDIEKIAKMAVDFSGADLKAVVEAAVEEKLAVALKTGKVAPLTTKDLQQAAKRIKPSTKDWFGTARNYALYSNESGQYDDVLDYIKRSKL